MSPQIITSLFDFIREALPSSGRRNKNKILNHVLIIFFLLLTTVLMLGLNVTVSENYNSHKKIKELEKEVQELKDYKIECLSVKEANNTLVGILSRHLPDSKNLLKEDLINEIRKSNKKTDLQKENDKNDGQEKLNNEITEQSIESSIEQLQKEDSVKSLESQRLILPKESKRRQEEKRLKQSQSN